MLFGCRWAAAVWFGSSTNYSVNPQSFHSVLRWTLDQIDQVATSSEKLLFFSKIATIGWHIWKGRNDYVFNHNPVDPIRVINSAAVAWDEYNKSLEEEENNRKKKEGIPPAHSVKAQWTPPPPNNLKFNCDVAMGINGSAAVIATVLRDSKGLLIDGRTKHVHVSSVLQGEGEALRLATLMARSKNLSEIEIESDNKTAIMLSATENVPPWDCCNVFLDIRDLAKEMSLKLTWTPRSTNAAAHWVATSTVRGLLSPDWVASPPPGLTSVLCKDFCPPS